MKILRAVLASLAGLTLAGTVFIGTVQPVANALPAPAVHISSVLNSSTSTLYVVTPGDTLSSIAMKFNVSWQGLYCENEKLIGNNPGFILPGITLVIATSSCSYEQEPATSGEVSTVVPVSTPQHIAWSLLPASNKAAEYACLNLVIERESSWNVHAYNPSGAYGIPQALPGDKMAGSWGQDWENSAYVQLYWMIKVYIPADYGTPCGAWQHELAYGYY
jgi:LysM repeat protein